MVATIAEMRNALRGAGETVAVRGRLSAEDKRRAQDLIDAAAAPPGDAYSDGAGPDDFGGEDDYLSADLPPAAGPAAGLGMGDDDTAAGHAAAGRDDYGGPGVPAERTPRQVRPARRGAATARARRLWARAGQRDQGKPRRKTKSKPRGGPRLSGASIIEHVLSQLAWAARPVPPLQKVLAMQADTSGVLLDQAIAGTPADVLLQFAARQEERAEIINGTVGPAAWVAAITFLGGAQTTAGPGGQPVVMLDEDGVPVWDQRTRLMIGGLRVSLMSYRKICQRSAAELQAAAEANAQRSAEADDLIRFFFATPEPGETPHDRENAAREAGARFTGQPAPQWPPAGPAVMVPFAGVAQDDLTAAMEDAARGAAAPVPATGAHGGS